MTRDVPRQPSLIGRRSKSNITGTCGIGLAEEAQILGPSSTISTNLIQIFATNFNPYHHLEGVNISPAPHLTLKLQDEGRGHKFQDL